MQLLAMLTMFMDHIGKIFFPDEQTWRFIGRIAFPIYCYCIVLGYHRTRDMGRYFARLLVIGLLSQLPYMLAFNTVGVNVIGTLLVSLAVLYALDRLKGRITLQVLVVLIACMGLDALPFDYGSYGLLLVLIYRYAREHTHTVVGMHLLLNVAFILYKGWTIQMASLIVTLVLAYAPELFRQLERIQPPKWLWRSFYPVHFIVLFLIAAFMS
ncbi:TraX family protein [Paenibacillus sp. y28]|uniref:TraX family protein n=1 Tax=Paenibacillus sp. y28 TaxID=3129110 RepID=UPI00301A310C